MKLNRLIKPLLKSGKRLKLILIAFIMLLCCFSCLEEYDIELTNKNEPKVIIEALLTNKTQCLVKITQSNTIINNYDTGHFQQQPINHALVILSDEYGQKDTAFPITYNGYDQYDSAFDRKLSEAHEYRISVGGGTSLLDTNYSGMLSFFYDSEGFAGFYSTYNFKATPGNTYKLSVTVNNQEFIAFDYMPDNNLVFDSIAKKITPNNKGDGTKLYVPSMFFKNDNKNSYYGISMYSDHDNISNKFSIAYGLINTNTLPAYVSGMPICSENDWPKLELYDEGDDLSYNILYSYSLTPFIYSFFDILFEQLNNDGGAYSPSPANLPTNFNNGALGYFKASELKRHLYNASNVIQ